MKKTPSPFLIQLQKRTAQACMGASSLRNQGAPGVLAAARQVVAKVDLTALSNVTRTRFFTILDNYTQLILSHFPANAQSWGAARKGLNLFFRDVTYNKDLCDFYDLSRVRKWLEVPLDNDVANALKIEPEGNKLPTWCRIKNLTPQISNEYQMVAKKVARRKRLARVDLDAYYWRSK